MKEGDEKAKSLLFKDAHLPWQGEFPYECLNRSLQKVGHPGVNPSSTLQEVKDALFDLMSTRTVKPEDRLAWDELRFSERRLVLDFFMYAFETGGDDNWSAALCDLPMPLQMPDFRELADGEPEYEKAVPLPSSFAPFPVPEAAPADAELLIAPPVDIGPVSINEVEILGDKYAR